MSSSRSPAPAIPFRSKKPLQSTPKSKSGDPIATQTPDKPPSGIASRLRNRRAALSVKEVRQIAGGNRTDQAVKSARRQISSWPEDSVSGARKSKKVPADAEESVKLPAKYEMLAEFLYSLDSSIRLLRLKGSIPSFTNISPKIESLTDRRFTHRHLAQLKYIMPEAIEITRVLQFDERISCMKPDLHVSINVDAIEMVEKLKSSSKNLQLRKIFRSRLADFYKAHPQGDEIPEELLPEPFNRSQITQAPNSSSTEVSTGSNVGLSHNAPLAGKQQPAAASHFSGSFRRHFSQKSSSAEPVNTQQDAEKKLLSLKEISSNSETSCSAPSLIQVLPSNPGDEGKPSADSSAMPLHCITATPCKLINSFDKNTPIKDAHSTPAKDVLTPITSMSRTPVSHPQKRCYMSPEDDPAFSKNKLVRRPPRNRSLKFETPLEDEEDEVNKMEDVPTDDDDDDVLSILPKSLLQSIKESERKIQEERDPAISQAKRRKQMIACLPKLFNMIHFLIQSLKRSVITKAELMQKIIAGHLDIVDSREIEEQLNLLLELAPEWISQKLSSSGDFLFCINKMASADTVRARLEEAK